MIQTKTAFIQTKVTISFSDGCEVKLGTDSGSVFIDKYDFEKYSTKINKALYKTQVQVLSGTEKFRNGNSVVCVRFGDFSKDCFVRTDDLVNE